MGSYRDYARTWKNQKEVTVGPALHFIQEDVPNEIAGAMIEWMEDVFVSSTSSTPTSGASVTWNGNEVWNIILVGVLSCFFRFTK